MCCVSIQNSLKKRKTKQQKNPKPQTAFQNKTLPQVGFFFSTQREFQQCHETYW